MTEQDDELDQLSKHIRNLTGISGAINEEITMHTQMLVRQIYLPGLSIHPPRVSTHPPCM
jgi:hypothetical protein